MAEQLEIEELTGMALANVLARKGHDGETIGALLGGPLPNCASAAMIGGTTYIGSGPGSWLALSAAPATDFAEGLSFTLAGRASVSDQSGAYCVIRIKGQSAVELLQRGAAIDLHPEIFAPGSAATTVIAHISVVLWMIDSEPTYGVAVFRTYLPDFRAWLTQTRLTLSLRNSSEQP